MRQALAKGDLGLKIRVSLVHGRVTWVKATYDSIHGPIASAWRIMSDFRTNDEFRLYVTIPANTTATVYIPTKNADEVMEGRHYTSQAEGVRFVGMQDGTAVYEVGSGTYHFVAPLP